MMHVPSTESADYRRAPLDGCAAPLLLTVTPQLAGTRLDRALAILLPEMSRSRIRQLIDAGQISVDGAVRAPKYLLRGGEQLAALLPARPADESHQPEARALPLVYEDAHLLVLEKPPGWVVHPGSGNREGTLLNALLHHTAAAATLPRAGIVHRLDKDTSGLMVAARSEPAQTALVRMIAAREVTRIYTALVRGQLRQPLVIDAPIGRHPVQRTKMAVVDESRGGKPARTHVTPLSQLPQHTLVRCKLETGRTHQIRVHLASRGHPLEGDPAYAGRPRGVSEAARAAIAAFARQALHASELAFAHPITGAPLQFKSALPADFNTLIAALKTE